MIPMHLLVKFPRFSKEYASITRSGDTIEKALANAEAALAYKSVFSPLDKYVTMTELQSRGVPFFEATVLYLDPKYKAKFTGTELRRLDGTLSKLLFVDDNAAVLEKMVETAVLTQRYQIATCAESNQVAGMVEEDPPDVLVVKHNIRGINGMGVMQQIREKGLQQKTVVHGHCDMGVVDRYFKAYTDVHYFVFYKSNVAISEIIDAVEKTLNGVKAKDKNMFLIM